MKKKSFTALGLASLLLAASSILSRFLGVLRDAVFSRIFGSGSEGGVFALDAYYLAFRIPDFLYTLLILGALSSAFIPLYTRLKKSEPERANHFVNTTLSTVFFLALFSSALLFVLAPWILPILAPGFSQETLSLSINLTRLLLLSPLFMGLSGLLQGIENVHKRFFGMALAPVVYNVSIILAAILWAETLGVYALVYGVLTGAVLHFLVQIPSIIHTSYRYQFLRPRWTPELRELFFMGFPRIIGMSAMQITLFVDFALLSLFSLGSVSLYSYALNIQSFPYGVIGVSAALAIFPKLSEEALESNLDAFVESFRKTFARIWFWILPATCGLFLVRDPLIQIFLQGGAFSAKDTALTGSIFSVLIWSALSLSFIPLLSRAFYALSNTKTPVLISLLTMLLNAGMSLFFIYYMDFSFLSIAFANCVASSFNAIVLFFALSKKMMRSPMDFIDLKSFFKSTVAVMLMIFVLLAVSQYVFPNAWSELFALSTLGALTYLGLVRLPWAVSVSK